MKLPPDWVFSAYRGQNANMHMCEAMLAAHAATGSARYLERAYVLADNMIRRQAQKTGGLVWEHYHSDWQPDWDHNRDDPRNLFRPWGFQPGHQVEWSKLLLILARHRPEAWLLPTAMRLFDVSLERAWDRQYGGICYGFAPDGKVCDTDKYFWVQAEALAAAALLAGQSGGEKYWDWYQRIWGYSWVHFRSCWITAMGPGTASSPRTTRSTATRRARRARRTTHCMGACYGVLRLLRNEVQS